jgi:hypothetical protein
VTRRSIEDLLAALSIIAQENSMVQMLPDPTFYPSAALAGEAPAGAQGRRTDRDRRGDTVSLRRSA